MLLIHSNNSSRAQPPPQPQPSASPNPSALSQYCAMPSRTTPSHCTWRTACPVPRAGALRRLHVSINHYPVKPVNHPNHNQVPGSIHPHRPVLRDGIAHHPQHHSHPSVLSQYCTMPSRTTPSIPRPSALSQYCAMPSRTPQPPGRRWHYSPFMRASSPLCWSNPR